jgi:hypothetical protein
MALVAPLDAALRTLGSDEVAAGAWMVDLGRYALGARSQAV